MQTIKKICDGMFVAINDLEDLYKSACYWKTNKFLSPYSIKENGKEVFIPRLEEEYKKLTEKHNKQKLDRYNLMFDAIEKTFNHFYRKNKTWKNMVTKRYEKMGYHFIIEDENGDTVSVLLKDIKDEKIKQNLVINKLKGDFKENLDKAQIFNKLQDKEFIPFLKELNPNVYFTHAILFDIDPLKDVGTDGLIILYTVDEEGNYVPVGSFSLQYKYRKYTDNDDYKLSIFHSKCGKEGCVIKMRNLQENKELGNYLNIDTTYPNHHFIITMNDDYRKLVKKQDCIDYEQKETPNSRKTHFFDINVVRRFYGKDKNDDINDITINSIFEYLRAINKFADEF